MGRGAGRIGQGRGAGYASVAVRWLWALLLLTALVAAVLRGGTRSFYCPAMGAMLDAPCCAHEAHGEDVPAVDAQEDGCCELRDLPHVPVAASAHDAPNVPGAVPQPGVPAYPVPRAQDAFALTRFRGAWAPSPPRAPRVHALAMVFLI